MRVWIITGILSLALQCVGQTITGRVVNGDNLAIENALVSKINDLSVWSKTDENGDFVLPGVAGDELKIGALYYETAVMDVLNASGQVFELREDELLSNDVYHISFDHLRPGDHYSLEELKKDFTVAYGKGFYDGSDEASNRAFVDVNESVDPDGTSLRVTFPKGKLKTSDSGVDTRIYLSGNYKTGSEFQADELYISYWVKYSDNFDFKCGGKMPSLGGEFENSIDGGNERWKGRTMWRNGGSIQFYPELPHDADKFDHDSLRFWGEKEFDGGDICNNEFTAYMRNGEWHNIELHYVLDDGVSGGVFEGWVDGGIGYKRIDSEVFGFYRRKGEGLDNLTINYIMISTFFGGSSVEYEPDEDVYAWFDEFRVSPERINEYERYNSNLITSHQEDVFEELNLYPNPSATGIFHLGAEETWEVYSLCGIKQAQGLGNRVDLSSYPKGVYLLTTGSRTTKVLYH